MRKQILALLLVLVLLPGLPPAARAESVQAIAGTVTATTEGTLTLYGSGTVYKLFLVDSQGRPICEVWRS